MFGLAFMQIPFIPSSMNPDCLPIVGVSSGGGRHRRAHGSRETGQDPSTLAGREALRKQSVIDLPGDCEAIERSGRQKEARIIGEPIGRCVHVPFDRVNHSITVLIHSCNLCCVGIEKPLVKVAHSGRSQR